MLGPGGPRGTPAPDGTRPTMACWRRAPAPHREHDVRNGQENLRRAASRDVGAGAPTAHQDGRARGLLLGRDLLDRLRDGGDPLRHRGGYGDEPPARPRPPRPDRHRGRAPDRDRRHFLPPDDLRLSEGRRRVRRQPREPRRVAVTRRRRLDPRRLHPHRGGVGVGGCRRHHLDPAVPRHRRAASGRGRARDHPVDQPGEPARHQGVRAPLRDPHLRLHRRRGRAHHARFDEELLRLVRRRRARCRSMPVRPRCCTRPAAHSVCS